LYFKYFCFYFFSIFLFSHDVRNPVALTPRATNRNLVVDLKDCLLNSVSRVSLDSKPNIVLLVLAVRRVKRNDVAFFTNPANVASPLSNHVAHVVGVNGNRSTENPGHVVSVLCCVCFSLCW
jgi:hypothetical protein